MYFYCLCIKVYDRTRYIILLVRQFKITHTHTNTDTRRPSSIYLYTRILVIILLIHIEQLILGDLLENKFKSRQCLKEMMDLYCRLEYLSIQNIIAIADALICTIQAISDMASENVISMLYGNEEALVTVDSQSHILYLFSDICQYVR